MEEAIEYSTTNFATFGIQPCYIPIIATTIVEHEFNGMK
jgi:hypothetical protein